MHVDANSWDGPLRVFTLLHAARPVVLNFGESGGVDITPRTDRVELVDAEHVGAWELPVVGSVPAPSVVLIRPDGVERLQPPVDSRELRTLIPHEVVWYEGVR